MAKISVEIEGSVDEVIGVLRRLGDAEGTRNCGVMLTGQRSNLLLASVRTRQPPKRRRWRCPTRLLPGNGRRCSPEISCPVLQPAARRMALHVWRAGAAGIHRSALCERAGADAHGAPLAVDADGPRAGKVPAGAWDDAVPAGGGQQPAAELLRRSRFRRGGECPDVRRGDATPVGR